MEPYRKRQRIYSPIRKEFLKTFSREQGYDMYERDELQDYEDMDKPVRGYEGEEDEEEEEDDDDEIDPVPDPESELQQRRSQLDFKLKSTFESIFEKYGRDFEGIGDEIDLETGRIVVNNGHLSEMRHERDAGTGRYDESTEYTEESIESSLGGDEMLLDYNDDEEEDEEDEVLDEGGQDSSDDGIDDDMEDDMILRGFTKATQNIQPESVLYSRHPPTLPIENPRNFHRLQPLTPIAQPSTAVPSQSQSFAQFRPQLGAQGHQYVSQQHSRKDSNPQHAWQAPTVSNRENPRNQDSIDSAWRISDLPQTSRKNEMGPSRRKGLPKQQTYRQDHVEPTWRVPDLPSESKWGNRNGVEPSWRIPELPTSLRPRSNLKPMTVNLLPAERSPSPGGGGSVWAEPEKERPYKPLAKKGHVSFTAEDDYILLDCVKKARIRGITMNANFWRGIEAQYPRHTYTKWRARYEKKYSYLEPDEIGEPESLQTTDSEPFAVPTRLPNPQKPRRTFLGTPPQIPVPQFQSLSPVLRGLYQTHVLVLPDNRQYDSPYTASQVLKPLASTTIPSHQNPEPVNSGLTKPVPKIPPHVERRDSRVLTWSKLIDAAESPTPEREIEGLPDARHVIRNILGSRRHSHSERKTSSRQQNDDKRRVSDQSLYSSHSHSHPTRNDFQIRDQPQPQFIDLTSSHSKRVPETENSHFPVPVPDKAPIGTASCPHIDCKSYPSRFYRLDRTIEEDSSQMAVHLFEEHRTTAFPCGELHCPYVGENGYFTQFELVEHVKSAHPNKTALQRLEARVSSNLSRDENPADASFDSTWNGPGSEQRGSENQETLCGSPQRAFISRVSLSSQHPSSGSDMDHTLTPRGVAGASTYTPMTSVSSIVVNHPSAHSDPGEGVGQDRSSVPILPTIEMPTPSISKGFGPIRESSIVEEDELPSRKQPQAHEREIELPDVQQSFSSTAGILGSDGAGSAVTDRTNRGQYSALHSPVMDASSPPRPRYQLRSSIPDSQASTAAIQISPPPAVRESSTTSSNQINPPQNLPSPMETPFLPGPVLAAKPQSPRVEKSLAKQMFKTPSRKRRELPGLDSDEDDELNLATDGFILLSSKPRNKKNPLETPDILKREDTPGIAGDPFITSIPARKKKRKLHQFQDEDDIDELTTDSPMHSLSLLGPSARKQAKFKAEEETEAATVQAIEQGGQKYKQLKARRGICTPRSAIAESGLGFVRTSTPLLDLTPGRKKGIHTNQNEVPDSTADSSSRVEVPASSDETSSSPMQGLLTPSGKSYRRGSVEIKEEGQGGKPVVIVRTPKGTLKKCGQNGFACRKSFCFRCGRSGFAVS